MAETGKDRRIEELEERHKPSGRPRPDDAKETEEAIERIHEAGEAPGTPDALDERFKREQLANNPAPNEDH
jgi:hypothetical protein